MDTGGEKKSSIKRRYCFMCFTHFHEVFVVGAEQNKLINGGNDRVFGLNVTLGFFCIQEAVDRLDPFTFW